MREDGVNNIKQNDNKGGKAELNLRTLPYHYLRKP